MRVLRVIMGCVDEGVRRAVVGALVRLAAGCDFRDRADAGRAMASFADVAEAREPLQQLLLDGGDTFVTRATAEALLRREDMTGLTAVASALARADDNHADWIHTAVLDVCGIYGGRRDAAVRMCEALIDGADVSLSSGAMRLRDMLAALDPVLRPLGKDRDERGCGRPEDG